MYNNRGIKLIVKRRNVESGKFQYLYGYSENEDFTFLDKRDSGYRIFETENEILTLLKKYFKSLIEGYRSDDPFSIIPVGILNYDYFIYNINDDEETLLKFIDINHSFSLIDRFKKFNNVYLFKNSIFEDKKVLIERIIKKYINNILESLHSSNFCKFEIVEESFSIKPLNKHDIISLPFLNSYKEEFKNNGIDINTVFVIKFTIIDYNGNYKYTKERNILIELSSFRDSCKNIVPNTMNIRTLGFVFN